MSPSGNISRFCLCALVIGVGVGCSLPLRDLGGALRHVSALVFRCHSDIAPWFPYERLSDGETATSFSGSPIHLLAQVLSTPSWEPLRIPSPAWVATLPVARPIPRPPSSSLFCALKATLRTLFSSVFATPPRSCPRTRLSALDNSSRHVGQGHRLHFLLDLLIRHEEEAHSGGC